MMVEPFHDMPYDGQHIMNRGAATCAAASFMLCLDPISFEATRGSVCHSHSCVMIGTFAIAASAHALAGTQSSARSTCESGLPLILLVEFVLLLSTTLMPIRFVIMQW